LELQIIDNATAELTLGMVQKPKVYRKFIRNIFKDVLPTALPKGDGYLMHGKRQCRLHDHSAKVLLMPQVENFYTARKENLQAGMMDYGKLQHHALTISRSQNTDRARPAAKNRNNQGPER